MLSVQLLQEHWTVEGSAVVVTADTVIINQLLAELELPQESPVNISDDRLALAFWGDELKSYVAWRGGSQAHCNGLSGQTNAMVNP